MDLVEALIALILMLFMVNVGMYFRIRFFDKTVTKKRAFKSFIIQTVALIIIFFSFELAHKMNWL